MEYINSANVILFKATYLTRFDVRVRQVSIRIRLMGTKIYFVCLCLFVVYFRLQIGFTFKEEINKMLHLDLAFYGPETWTLREIDYKFLQRFEMWCWRRMET
jgi:hypothetical protein